MLIDNFKKAEKALMDHVGADRILPVELDFVEKPWAINGTSLELEEYHKYCTLILETPSSKQQVYRGEEYTMVNTFFIDSESACSVFLKNSNEFLEDNE